LSAPSLLHKARAGAVLLSIEGESQIVDAYRALRALPEGDSSDVLVEEMVDPGVEVLVAARADAVVPALVIGLGGVWTETLADAVVVPLPAQAARIADAVRSLRGSALLEGTDVDGLALLAERVGEILVSDRLELLELNPVAVHEHGCVVLDALAL